MSDELKQLGKRLREMRDICGYTPEDVAARLGTGPERLLDYETSGDNVPISVLFELSALYGVDMTELLTGKSPKLSTYYVVKKGHGVDIDRYPGYRYGSLAYNFKRRIMEPLMVTVEPDDKTMALVTHPGQEFNYVVEGTVLIILDDEEIVLEEGESIYFDPMLPHGQKAMHNKTARFLTVIAE